MPFGQLAEEQRKADEKIVQAEEERKAEEERELAEDPIKAQFYKALDAKEGEDPPTKASPTKEATRSQFFKALDEPEATPAPEIKTPPPPAEKDGELDYLRDRQIIDDPIRQQFFQALDGPEEEEGAEKKAEAIKASSAAEVPKPSYAPPDKPEDETPEAKAERTSTVSDHLYEVAPALWSGALKLAEETDRFANFILDNTLGASIPAWETDAKGRVTLKMITEKEAKKREAAGEKLFTYNLPDRPELKTITGKVTEAIAHFMTAFIGTGKVLKGIGMGSRFLKGSGFVATAGQGALTGAIADYAFMNPHEARLSNLVQHYPHLRNPIAEALAADPNDTAAIGRLKNAAEGFIIGAPLDLFISIIRTMAASRRAGVASEFDPVSFKVDVPERAPDPDPELSIRERREQMSSRIKGEAPSARPGEPVRPDEPVEPVRAEEPIGAEGPREPRDPSARGDVPPARADEPVDASGRPTEPARPTEATQASEPRDPSARADVPPARADEPVDASGRPIDPARPTEGPQAADPRDPSARADVPPTRPDEPVDASGRPVDPARPSDGAPTAEPRDPSARADVPPTRPDEPVDPTEPIDAADPVKGADEPTRPRVPLDRDPQEPVERVGDEFIDPARDDGELLTVQVGKDGEPDKIAINYARLETVDDITKLRDDLAKSDAVRVDEARRHVQSNEETVKLAEKLDLKIEELEARQVGEALNAEQIIAARKILEESEVRLIELAKVAVKLGEGVDAQQAFRQHISRHLALQRAFYGARAEAGRALQAFNIPAGDATTRSLVASENIIAAGGSTEIRKLAKLVLDSGPARAARVSDNPTVSKAAFEAWMGGLLSSAATHSANAVGSLINIGYGNLDRLFAGLVHAGRKGARKLTPDRFLSQEALERGGVELGEFKAALYAQGAAIREAFHLAGTVFKDDLAQEWILDYTRKGLPGDLGSISKAETGFQPAFGATAFKLNKSGALGRIADALGSLVRLPGKALNASDTFFKVIAYRGELHAQAFRKASQEGLEGKALKDRIVELVNSPDDSIRKEATRSAEYLTFTQPLGDRGQAINAALNKVPGLRILVPFFRTPVNIIKTVGEHTPFAPLATKVREEIAAGGARADIAYAKMLSGTAVIGAAVPLALEGIITGAGPANLDEKKRWRETGWQPFSVKIGDTYYSYERLDPIATPLGIVASAVEVLTHIDWDDDLAGQIGSAVTFSVIGNLFSKTWVKGVSDFLELVGDLSSDPDAKHTKLKQFLAQKAGSLVPAGIGSIERVVDPTLRDTGNDWWTWHKKMISKIPGLSSTLPPVRNLFGEPVVLQGGIGPDIMSPIYTSKDKDDPIANELREQRTRIAMPRRIINGVKLTDQEYDSYVQLSAGINNRYLPLSLKEELAQLFSSPEYKTAGDGKDGGKSWLIKRVISGYRSDAKRQLLEDNPRIQAKLDELDKKKLDALYGR